MILGHGKLASDIICTKIIPRKQCLLLSSPSGWRWPIVVVPTVVYKETGRRCVVTISSTKDGNKPLLHQADNVADGTSMPRDIAAETAGAGNCASQSKARRP